MLRAVINAAPGVRDVLTFRGIGSDILVSRFRGDAMVPAHTWPASLDEIRRATERILGPVTPHPIETCCYGNGHYWDPVARQQRECPCGASSLGT
jgi:hypothetical protein